ncbi:hypothetical protein C3920_00205 [Novacetimonas pomaceti]|uniref:Uncharacterized protein n=1 Tax=Novacetimonas pomaceti TaxID=2021998 RepID=A0ABX5P674_9PROT|nr:hypothetical protein C3920_00205 [Novacetimonas pomaceti]
MARGGLSRFSRPFSRPREPPVTACFSPSGDPDFHRPCFPGPCFPDHISRVMSPSAMRGCPFFAGWRAGMASVGAALRARRLSYGGGACRDAIIAGTIRSTSWRIIDR